MQRKGRSVEEVLAAWRESGLSLIESTMAWMRVGRVDLGEARDTVVGSLAWRDQRDAFWADQDAFWDAMREIADDYKEFPDGTVRATFDLTKSDKDDPG